MEQFLIRGDPPVTPKRKIDDADSSLKSAKKHRQTLLDSNTYARLRNDDKGDSIHTPTHTTQNTKKPRLPPIVLYNKLINPKDTYSKIQSWVSHPVHFKQQGDRRLVYTYDKEDFNTIKDKFRELNFDWHGHKSEDDMPKKLVLKGIDIVYTREEIFEDLKSQYEHVTDVRQMSKTNEKGEKILLPVHVVYFTWNTRLSVAKKVLQFCCYHKIKWEFLQKNNKKKIKQCHNCQYFGHHSSDCGRVHRCVKCDDKHSPGKCIRVKDVDDPVCCNCKGKHPANYQGCPRIKEYLKNERKPSTKRQHNKTPAKENNGVAFHGKQQQQQSHVKRQLSYSSTLRGHNSGATAGVSWMDIPTSERLDVRGLSGVSNNINPRFQSDPTAGSFSFITNEINSLFGVSFVEMMSTVNAFLPMYKQCHDPTQKKLLLVEFMFELSK